MIILAIRTDKPEAELYLYDGLTKKTEIRWQAHLKLSETLNSKIEEILNSSSISYSDIDGIAVFKGPGSFTGLRIGTAVANALAYSLTIPIVSNDGKEWIKRSINALVSGNNDKIVIPEYGSEAHTTQPRK